ncbi:hypothetical protein RI367_006585 [Sorochytrium milnesiophthora]
MSTSVKRHAVCLSSDEAALVRMSLALQHIANQPSQVDSDDDDDGDVSDVISLYSDADSDCDTSLPPPPARRSSLQHFSVRTSQCLLVNRVSTPLPAF